MPIARDYISPMQSDVVSRYFLDRNGVQTRRMANVPGKGHFDLAAEVTGNAQGDLYAQMFALGYVRVMETTSAIHVESPRALTRKQKNFLDDRCIETGKELVLNNREFIESKDPRALGAKVAAQLLA